MKNTCTHFCGIAVLHVHISVQSSIAIWRNRWLMDAHIAIYIISYNYTIRNRKLCIWVSVGSVVSGNLIKNTRK